MRVLGMISGTSHDGADVAVVEFTADGDHLRAHIVVETSTPLPAGLRRDLIAALPPADVTMAEVCRLDTLLGQFFAECAQKSAKGNDVDLVVSHGQTTYHWVEGAHALGTLQLGQPAWIARATGLPVLSDVRSADIAAGGHGAPLVPILDVLLLGGLDGVSAALNLGGISNMTVTGAGDPFAYDLGPANALIDAAVADQTEGRELFDADGARGARGRVDEAMLTDLLADPYYALPSPKSTGKEHFNAAYVREAAARHPGVAGDDLVATLTELTARVVAREVERHGVRTLVASGGGADNPTLMARIAACCKGVRLLTTADLGVPTATKEAVAFALVGYLSAHGLPGNVPSCTGAREPVVLGSVAPPLAVRATPAFPATLEVV